ncbi:response regulator [Halohasta litorea]|uniref:Response regulator n=1 Tax=Halohasta litorea TaxID=869891 RepID=A0ABD6D6L4_9EURY|nr:response regulator [Halohasta litorea]
MSDHEPGTPTVLVVDDEEDIADIYSLQLQDRYTVRTVYGGQAAIEVVDEDVDVVLLDRRMPELSGNEVLERIRADGYDCRVIMVTAIDPEFDIIEMPFDDYLCKPVDKETLVEAIEQQLTAKQYDETVSELFRATSKLTVLKGEMSQDELEDSEEYQRLKETTDAMRSDAESLMSELDDFEAAFKAIDRSSN